MVAKEITYQYLQGRMSELLIWQVLRISCLSDVIDRH